MSALQSEEYGHPRGHLRYGKRGKPVACRDHPSWLSACQFSGSVSMGAPWAVSSTIWERNRACINVNVRFVA